MRKINIGYEPAVVSEEALILAKGYIGYLEVIARLHAQIDEEAKARRVAVENMKRVEANFRDMSDKLKKYEKEYDPDRLAYAVEDAVEDAVNQERVKTIVTIVVGNSDSLDRLIRSGQSALAIALATRQLPFIEELLESLYSPDYYIDIDIRLRLHWMCRVACTTPIPGTQLHEAVYTLLNPGEDGLWDDSEPYYCETYESYVLEISRLNLCKDVSIP